MKYVSPTFANRLIGDLSREAEACYVEHHRQGTYPNLDSSGARRARRAVEYALPDQARNLAGGYAATLRTDAPPTVRAASSSIATNIRNLICNIENQEQRRAVLEPAGFRAVTQWIGRPVRISSLAMHIRATEMYPNHETAVPGSEPLPYGLSGILLDYDADRESVYLAAGQEALSADLLFPMIFSLCVPTQAARTMPIG